MAAGPKDAGQSQTDENTRKAAAHREAALRSAALSEDPGLVNTSSVAHQTFRQNSERLQQASEAKHDAQTQELSFVKDHERGNYGELKQEHADAMGQNATDGQGKQQPSGEREQQELRFVKDGSRGNHAAMKQEHAAGTGENLNFVKDQDQDLSQGR